MSIIIQQPDALSFSANLKKFIVSSTEAISVLLSKGADLILEEVYYPGANNQVEINLREIIHQELSVSIPENTSIVNEQASAVAEFTATIDETEVVFTVVKGGVFRLKSAPAEWLTNNNQSWQPQEKKVIYNQPEWLSCYAVEKLSVKLLAYFADGSTEEITFASLNAGKVNSVNCSFTVVDAALEGNNPVAWDIWKVDQYSNPVGYTQRYILREKGEWENLFIWANTVGGIDSVSFTGARQTDEKIEHLVADLFDETLQEYDDNRQREIKQNTGYLDKYHSAWLKDFFLSPEKFEVDALGDLYRVALTESEVVTTNEDDIYMFELTFRYSDERPLLNIDRTTNAVPYFIPGSITLPKLIRDLPIGNAQGDWVLAVQNPSSPVWYQITVDQFISLVNTESGAGESSGSGQSSAKTERDYGEIVWKSGLTYHATNHHFYISGIEIYAFARDITLLDADPNYPRIDVFAGDTYGNIFAIAGTPAANPLKPVPANNQIELTQAFVPAGAVEPSDVEVEKIYDEGDAEEWIAAATSDDDIIVDLANASNPGNGTKSIAVKLSIPDERGGSPTHHIGEEYQGGIIFWLAQDGKSGLIAAKVDLAILSQYQSGSHTNGTQEGIDIGYGWDNTLAMMSSNTSNQAGMVAPLCRYYQGGGYLDWFAPSRGELDLMRYYKTRIGGFTDDKYWSSTEAISDSADYAYGIDFNKSNGWFKERKSNQHRVRAIRAFDDTNQSYNVPVEVYSPTNTKISFTAPADKILNSAILSFQMKTSLAWLGNTALLIESYYHEVKTGGILLQAVNSVGFDASNTEDWQEIIVQLYNFGLTTKSCDKFVFHLINSWPNNITLMLDSIRVQFDPNQEDPANNNLPSGGEDNQIIVKKSTKNYDAGWQFVGYDSIAPNMKSRITDSSGVWDVSGNAIIEATISSAVDVSLSNLKENKAITVLLTIESGGSLTLPSYCKLIDGSIDLSSSPNAGTYIIDFHCLIATEGNEFVRTSIGKVVES